MGHTVHAFLESEDRSGAETFIAAIADGLITTSGDNIRLRKDLPLIALLYPWSNNATYQPSSMRLSSPSIAGNPIRLIGGVGLNFLGGGIYDFRDAPLNLIRPGDNVTAYGFEEDEAGVAHYLGLALIVSDGQIPKGPRPQLTNIHKCTCTATTAATWTTLSLTETDSLPSGTYEMYGARVLHSAIMAARFIFKGIEERPAVIPINDIDEVLHPFSEYWGKGYKFTIPDGLPSIEVLETAGSGTVSVELFLRKIA